MSQDGTPPNQDVAALAHSLAAQGVHYLHHMELQPPKAKSRKESLAYYRIANHYKFILQTFFDCLCFPRLIILEVPPCARRSPAGLWPACAARSPARLHGHACAHESSALASPAPAWTRAWRCASAASSTPTARAAGAAMSCPMGCPAPFKG